jgi:hypothetical protein
MADFIFGVFGGALAELLQWVRIKRELHRGLPDWSRSTTYWIITTLMALAGGVLVVAYKGSGTTMNSILAINIGASAPLLLSKFVEKIPPIAPGAID